MISQLMENGNGSEHSLLIGDAAPLFSCRSTMGDLSLQGYRGRWLVFFSHPADFTPVCTSEFVAFAKAMPEFEAIDCALLGLSVDSLFSHVAWVQSIQERFGLLVPFPIVEDPSMAIAKAYGMIHHDAGSTGTVRACFIIDPAGHIRMIHWYPMSIGRNVAEILRCVKALQVSDQNSVLLPEGWQPGDEVIIPTEMKASGDAVVSDWLYRTRPLEAA